MPVGDGWLGLVFSPDGKFVYVGGGAQYCVSEFSFNAGELKLIRRLEIAPGVKPGTMDFVGDVAVSPDGRLIYAADLFHDQIQVINIPSGNLAGKIKTGRRPYRILFHPDGASFFVSSWADAAVLQHDARTGSEMSRIRLGPHPTDMLLSDRKPEDDESGMRYRLFVTAANTNNVFSVGISDTKEMRILETLHVALTPRQPLGMTPSALALNTDQTRLFVACSDANAVAVADLTEARSRVEGFIPTGWYPTAVRSLPGGRLIVLNGRGGGSYPAQVYWGRSMLPRSTG